ncbi:MAG: regulatory protein RecX [Phycisphaerales bacterium]|nr:regulatory protein RecX [Phycisphaerales bacterium]
MTRPPSQSRVQPPSTDPARAAIDHALRILTARDRSRATLLRKLAEKDHSPAHANAAADHLARLGLLDDRRYAENLVRAQLARKPAGRSFLLARLRKDGIDQKLAETVIAEALAPRDLAAEAADLARRKARTMQTLAPEIRQRRLFAMLARRGFDPDTARAALELALTDPPDEST